MTDKHPRYPTAWQQRSQAVDWEKLARLIKMKSTSAWVLIFFMGVCVTTGQAHLLLFFFALLLLVETC